jgi:preprotein translocase subunit YajC
MLIFGFLLQQQPGGLTSLLGFLPLVAILAIFYLLVFLPMQRQKKQQAEMVKSLKGGDVVVTSGGLIGTVHSVSDEAIVLRVKPDNVKLQVARTAVSGLLNDSPGK